jgi:hypothetical protein
MLFAVFALGSLLSAAPALEARLDAFLVELQRASAKDDRRAIAAMVEYPLTVFAGGWNIPVKDRATFLQSYDAFFTEDVKDAIAAASAKQRIEPTAAFLPIGKVLRVKPVGGTFRIVAIVMPPPGHKLRAARRDTTRVSFSAHQDAALFTGSLAVGEHESYLVRAKRNELLEVRIEGIVGRSVVGRVLDAETGVPVDARAREGTRVWAGRVPTAGDYRIDVVRTLSAGDPVLIYRLSVSLR